MTESEILQRALNTFGEIEVEDFSLSESFWLEKTYKKGDFYNEHRTVCKHLGFVIEGVFRSFYVDDKTGEEKNVFLYSKNQILVAFKSFVTQTPCNYHTQAMADSKILFIHVDRLKELYQQSHKWERFGRLIAEEAFQIAINRTESFLFQSPEQRYLDLIKNHPDIFNHIPLYHISSYLGIQGPSLSRIRKRIVNR